MDIIRLPVCEPLQLMHIVSQRKSPDSKCQVNTNLSSASVAAFYPLRMNNVITEILLLLDYCLSLSRISSHNSILYVCKHYTIINYPIHLYLYITWTDLIRTGTLYTNAHATHNLTEANKYFCNLSFVHTLLHSLPSRVDDPHQPIHCEFGYTPVHFIFKLNSGLSMVHMNICILTFFVHTYKCEKSEAI